MREIDTYDGDTSNYHFGKGDGVFVTTYQYRELEKENADLRAQLEASEFHRSNNLIEISELCAKLAEARKDSERLDFMCKKTKYGTYPLVTFMIKKYIIEVEILGGYKTLGLGSTPREAIDNAMKGGE